METIIRQIRRIGNIFAAMIVAFILCLLITLLATSCRSAKQATTTHSDSLSMEVRKETFYVTDTLYVEIPAQAAERTTRDSLSRLENEYALSEARINPDGTLYHSLETKQQKKPVEFQKPVEHCDSIVTRYTTTVNTEYVEVEKKLSFWQRLTLYMGYAAEGVLLALFIYAFAFIRSQLKK